MKQKVIYEFELHEIELLKVSKLMSLPENPCDTCGQKPSDCCGCPRYDDYRAAWSLYDQAGISEMARKILYRHSLLKKRDELNVLIEEITSKIPAEVLE